MTVYHGSSVDIKTSLLPQLSNHGMPLVYLSKHKLISGFYIVRNNFYPYRFPNMNVPLRYVEYFEDMFRYFYEGKSGFIYEVDYNQSMVNPTKMEGLFASLEPVEIKGREIIEDTYAYYMKEEKEGNFILNKYCQMTELEKNKVIESMVKEVRAKDLKENDGNILTKTIIEKIPKVWEIAQSQRINQSKNDA